MTASTETPTPPPSAARDAPTVEPPLLVTRYVVQDALGRGGIGVVHAAIDTRLRRTVALKHLHQQTPRARQRFLREMELAARLEHPAIVPIYDADIDDVGEPFLAMRRVQGVSLASAIAARDELDARLTLLPHVIAVAEAVAYAHRQHIVHRDIKPHNVLVGELGETFLVDWGLAKDFAAQDDDDDNHQDGAPANAQVQQLTAAGGIVGTPAYMSPQQARGTTDDGRALDGQAHQQNDVYALGALLYHVLVGAPPYRDVAASADEVLRRLKVAPPTPVEVLSPSAPRELCAIVARAMQTQASARYPSAIELVADLKRFQAGRWVLAHHYSTRERLHRLWRRYRAQWLALLLTLTTVGAVSTWSLARVVAARNDALAQNRALLILQASSAVDKDPTAALAWLHALLGQAKPTDLHDTEQQGVRGILADALQHGVASDVLDLRIKIEHLIATPHGDAFAVATDRQVMVWDAASRRVTARFDADDPIELATIDDGDGRYRLVSRGRQGTLRVYPPLQRDNTPVDAQALPMTHVGDHGWSNGMALWRVGAHHFGALAAVDGQLRIFDLDAAPTPSPRVLLQHAAAIESVAVSADGTWVASASGNALWVNAVATGQRRFIHRTPLAVGAVRFVGSDDEVMYTLADGTVALVALASGNVRVLVPGRGVRVDELVLFHSRRGVALGYHDGLVVVAWLTGESVSLHGHEQELVALSMSADDRVVLSGGLDRTVRAWHVDHERHSGRAVQRWRGHFGIVEAAALSRTGGHVMSGGQDGTLRIWPYDDVAREWPGHTDDIYMVRVSPDGERVATAGKDRTVRLWRRETGEVEVVGTLPHVAYAVAFSPDMRWLAASGYGPTVDVWALRKDPAGGVRTDPASHRVLEGHQGSVWRVEFSADSQQLVSASADGTSRRWSTTDWRGSLLHAHEYEGALYVATSPDSAWAATTGMDKTARLSRLNTDTPTTIVLRGHSERLLRLAFSPSSAWLATGAWDETVRLWRTADGSAGCVAVNGGRIRSLVFVDDDTLAIGADDGSVRLLDRESCRQQTLGHHGNYVRELDVTKDGLMLSMGWDETVKIWDTRAQAPQQLVGVLHRDDVVMSAVFSPDGEWLVLGGYEKRVAWLPRAAFARLPTDARVWDLRHATHALVDNDAQGGVRIASPLALDAAASR